MAEEKKVEKKSLLGKWQAMAYDQNADKGWLRKFWDDYFKKEKSVYEVLLSDPDEKIEGKVGDLAARFGLTDLEMAGFLDGINDSLITANDLSNLSEKSKVNLIYDQEKLYKNMVGASADWLYNLPQWDALIPKDRQKELFMEQKRSGTVIKEKKVGRNDPCPCGSGKKYKHCCGRS